MADPRCQRVPCSAAGTEQRQVRLNRALRWYDVIVRVCPRHAAKLDRDEAEAQETKGESDVSYGPTR